MRHKDNSIATGYLEVIKIYPNGEEEVHFSDKNTITSGMGTTLGILFSESIGGSTNILDYQISYSQLGVCGVSTYGVSTVQLVSAIPFSFLSSTSLISDTHTQLIGVTQTTDQPFVRIAPNNIYRASPTSVRYHIIIPSDDLNLGVPINEIGLFSKNPRGQNPEESILCAYKVFSNLIKTSDFAVLFRWSITF